MKRTITKICALVVSVAGIAVILGWIFNIPSLKSLSPYWVSMKFSTAVCFLLSGVTLYFIARAFDGKFDQAQVVISIATLIILLIMGTLFFSTFFRVHTGVEDLFIQEIDVSAKTVVPGRPFLTTMINFILIALAGIFTILDIKRAEFKLRVIGLIVGMIGALAVVGYAFNAPHLYYYVAGINSAMACNTAFLFVLLGAGLLCL